MPNPVINAVPTTGTGDRGDLIDLFQQRQAFVVFTVAEIQGDDFTGHRLLLLLTTRRYYALDASEAGADDGVNIIEDAGGNKFVLVNEGVANAANIAASISGVSSKLLPALADTIPIIDSEDAGALKQIPFTNLKDWIEGFGRRSLMAAETFHVATTGDDSTGDGSTGSPWATAEKAMDHIASSLDLGIHNVTVQFADGTYTNPIILKRYVTAGGKVIFQGNSSAHDAVHFSMAGDCIKTPDNGQAGQFRVQYMKVSSSGVRGIYVTGSGLALEVGNFYFGACGAYQVEASYNAMIFYAGPWHFTGGALVGIWAGRKALIFLSGGIFYYHGAIGYGARNFHFGEMGWIDAYSMTFDTATYAGSVTGKRYEGNGLAGCFVNGAGASYIPGTIAGTAPTNGAEYY